MAAPTRAASPPDPTRVVREVQRVADDRHLHQPDAPQHHPDGEQRQQAQGRVEEAAGDHDRGVVPQHGVREPAPQSADRECEEQQEPGARATSHRPRVYHEEPRGRARGGRALVTRDGCRVVSGTCRSNELSWCSPIPTTPSSARPGTVATWTREGTQVEYVCVTDGSAGSNEPGADRDELAALAARRAARRVRRAWASENCTFLGVRDGYVELTLDLRKAITREVRRFRPDIFVVPDPIRLWDPERALHQPHRPSDRRHGVPRRGQPRRADPAAVPRAARRGVRAVRDPADVDAHAGRTPTRSSTSPRRSS